jgi:hypothetical protein
LIGSFGKRVTIATVQTFESECNGEATCCRLCSTTAQKEVSPKGARLHAKSKAKEEEFGLEMVFIDLNDQSGPQ